MIFAFSETLYNRFFSITWEIRILYHIVMQIISKIVSTGRTTMTVKDSKETNLRPFLIDCEYFTLGLDYIQNDTYSVFIVISDNALVSISCISFNDSTRFIRSFSYFMILQLKLFRVYRSWILTKYQSLNIYKLDITWDTGIVLIH